MILALLASLLSSTPEPLSGFPGFGSKPFSFYGLKTPGQPSNSFFNQAMWFLILAMEVQNEIEIVSERSPTCVVGRDRAREFGSHLLEVAPQ